MADGRMARSPALAPVAPVEEFIPDYLKVAPTESQVRFEMVSFGPFVPCLDEHDPLIVWASLDTHKGIAQVASEQLWRRVIQYQTAHPRAWRIVPVRWQYQPQ